MKNQIFQEIGLSFAQANTAAIAGWQRLASHWLHAGASSFEDTVALAQKASAARTPADILSIQRQAAEAALSKALKNANEVADIAKSISNDISTPLTKYLSNRESVAQAAE